MAQITIIVAILAGVFFIISTIASGFVNSAEYGSYLHVLHTGVLSIPDVLNEVKKMWVNMTWTVLIIEVVRNWPVILGYVWIFFDILNLPSMSSLLIASSLLSWLGVMLLMLFITLIFTLLTVYSYPAAASGFHGFAAVKESIRVFLKLPSNTISYALLRMVSTILISIIAFITSFIGIQISAIITILISFIITPVSHVFKTSIFLKAQTDPIFAPLPLGPPVLKDVYQYVWRTGLGKIKRVFKNSLDS